MSKPVKTVGRTVNPTPYAISQFADRRPETVTSAAGDAPLASVVVVLVGSADGQVAPRPGAKALTERCGLTWDGLFDAAAFEGAAASVHTVQTAGVVAGSDVHKVVFVGVGKGSAKDFQTAGALTMTNAKGHAKVTTNAVDGLGSLETQAFVEGLVLGGYRVPSAATAEKKDKDQLPAVVELCGTVDQPAVDRGQVTGAGTVIARELAAMQSSVKTPAWMVSEFGRRIADIPHTSLEVFETDKLQELGFGGTLAVGESGEVAPRVAILTYEPQDAGEHIAFVGKGVTFDTGGISLKPREAMLMMRTDMTGSAVVFGAFCTIASLGLPTKVTTVIPLAENSFDEDSYLPSDVVTCYGGTTVEIANTDAEGRMVLADGLAYVADKIRPDVVVDVATLTGAATLALGRTHGAAYSNDDEVAEQLADAGDLSRERLWHMPLTDDYRVALESKVADLNHISEPGVKTGAGSVVAALFLEHFAGDLTWAHLDIAGPGRAEGAAPGVAVGATGFGVRALTEWVATRAS